MFFKQNIWWYQKGLKITSLLEIYKKQDICYIYHFKIKKLLILFYEER